MLKGISLVTYPIARKGTKILGAAALGAAVRAFFEIPNMRRFLVEKGSMRGAEGDAYE